MNCKNAKIYISAGLDGELSERERIDLDRHLQRCSGCSEERAKVSALASAMHSWKDIEPSPWLSQSFSAKICDLQCEPQPVRLRRSPWIIGTATAGLVTAAFAFLMITQYQPKPDVTETSIPKPVAVIQPRTVENPPVVEKVARPAPVVQPTSEAESAPEAKPEVPVVAESKTPAAPIAPTHARRTIHAAYVPASGYTRRTIERNEGRLQFGSTQPSVMSSRSGVAMDRGKQDEERAKEFLLNRFFKKSRNVNGDATAVVADNLNGAGAKMDSTVERIRGALRKAADVIAEDNASSVSAEKPAESNEGNTL